MKLKRATRTHADCRKLQILETAIIVSMDVGLQNLTAEHIARKAKVTRSLINHHFHGIKNLKWLIVKTAIDRRILPIIAQGLLSKEPRFKNISPDLRDEALKSINGVTPQ